jgi:hypothetical protein
MLGTGRICGDIREVDFCLVSDGKLPFGYFSGIPEPLQSYLIQPKIYVLLFLKFFYQPVHDLHIDIVATQMSIAIGRLNHESAFPNLKD